MARGTSLAPGIALPLLVIHDRGDREVPWSEGDRLTRGWPGARLLTTEGLGHNRILRDPDVVEAVAGFVAQAREATTMRA